MGVFLSLVLGRVAQLPPPHFSPITQSESDLAVGPWGVLMTINFVSRGALSLLFICALVQTLKRRGGAGPLSAAEPP